MLGIGKEGKGRSRKREGGREGRKRQDQGGGEEGLSKVHVDVC